MDVALLLSDPTEVSQGPAGSRTVPKQQPKGKKELLPAEKWTYTLQQLVSTYDYLTELSVAQFVKQANPVAIHTVGFKSKTEARAVMTDYQKQGQLTLFLTADHARPLQESAEKFLNQKKAEMKAKADIAASQNSYSSKSSQRNERIKDSRDKLGRILERKFNSTNRQFGAGLRKLLKQLPSDQTEQLDDLFETFMNYTGGPALEAASSHPEKIVEIFHFCDKPDFIMLLLREMYDKYTPMHEKWNGLVLCFHSAISEIAPSFSWQTMIAKHSKIHPDCNDLFESYAKLKVDEGWSWQAVNLAASFGGLRFFLREIEAQAIKAGSSITQDVIQSAWDSNAAKKPHACNNVGKVLSALYLNFPGLTSQVLKKIVHDPRTLGVDSAIQALYQYREKIDPEVVCDAVTVVLNANDHSADIPSLLLLLDGFENECKAVTSLFAQPKTYPHLSIKLNSHEFKNLMINAQTVDVIEMCKNKVSFSSLIASAEKFTKARSCMSPAEEAALITKIDAELSQSGKQNAKQWWTFSETLKKHFDTQSEKKGLPLRPYQKYCAAILCADISFLLQQNSTNGTNHPIRVCWKLGAGQGKTLIYLLMAMMLRTSPETRDSFKKIAVILPSPELAKQAQKVAANNGIKGVQFLETANFAAYKADLYIVDEADACIKNYSVVFGDDETAALQGFASLKDKNIILCSATFNLFQSFFIEDVLGIPEDEWVIFEPVRQYISGEEQKPILRYQDAPADADLRLLIEHDMQKRKDVPYIFFLEDMQKPQTKKVISQALGERVSQLVEVADSGTLNDEQEILASKSTGIWLIDAKFGRGFDFKLQKDARVFVIINGLGKIDGSDIEQMAGRGNRSQGQLEATVILDQNRVKTMKNCQQLIQTNNEALQTPVVQLIQALYEGWNTLGDRPKSKGLRLREALFTELPTKWHLGVSQFMSTNSDIYTFLTGGEVAGTVVKQSK